jgi:hypothetical protein
MDDEEFYEEEEEEEEESEYEEGMMDAAEGPMVETKLLKEVVATIRQEGLQEPVRVLITVRSGAAWPSLASRHVLLLLVWP